MTLFLTLDVMFLPRWWAAVTAASNIIFWKEHDKGGHFASVERPDALVADIREFTQLLSSQKREALVKSGKLKL